MIVEYIRYKLKNHTGDDFEATFAGFESAYREAAQYLDKSPNCQGYQLARCVEEPDRYVLRIDWDSVEGHLMGFRRTPDFSRFFEAIKAYIGEIEEMQHYMPTSVVSKKEPRETPLS
jgi:quinol monooxygenase YgiN